MEAQDRPWLTPIPSETFYALIIGINEYPYYNPTWGSLEGTQEDSAIVPNIDLEGAVADANAMEDFLLKKMKASKNNLINLQNTEATRQGILDGFEKLQAISKASENPCFVIYYSGHGASALAPSEWDDEDFNVKDLPGSTNERRVVEMLCPSDIGRTIEMVDGGVTVTEGILDRTICSLLNILSRERGNNITFIADCCCSGGMNRYELASTIPGRIPRYMTYPPPVTAKEHTDLAFRASPIHRNMRVATGFGGSFDESHVFLSACSRKERAWEDSGHGVFTTALLDFLRNNNLEEVTYSSLMDRLQIPEWSRQTPHCMGKNADRPVFNTRGTPLDPSYILCKRAKIKSGKEFLALHAGSLQGIRKGEHFSIHERRPLEGEPAPAAVFTGATAISVSTTTSVLDYLPAAALGHTPDTPQIFYARATDWKNDPTPIYCQNAGFLNTIFPAGSQETRLIATELPTDNPGQPSLLLSVDGNSIYMDRVDPFINTYIPGRFPHQFKHNATEDIRIIIGSWRHFNYHLHRRSQNNFSEVRIELHRLESVAGNSGELKKVGSNLLLNEPTQINCIKSEDQFTKVGMTLYNDSDLPLYPCILYFDPSDLTITPWSLPPQGAGKGRVDPPLLPHSKLTIGYGYGGATPWEFYFDEDHHQDIGFFKVFFSCLPANFLCLTQSSPFERLKNRPLFKRERSSQEKQIEGLERLDRHSWGSKVITLIQVASDK